MARIARRALRIRDLPLFSLGEPFQSVADADGMLGLRFFEPRYVEMARRILPPTGQGSNFGYSESYPPRPGSSGMLASIDEFSWQDTAESQVVLMAKGMRRFRVLSLRAEEICKRQAPLYVAHVQLLEERDVARVSSWTAQREAVGQGDPTSSDEAAVPAGTYLVASMAAPVYESPESWRVIGKIPAGVGVISAGPPEVVEGYTMIPIAPSGAVELTLFHNPSSKGANVLELPKETAIRQVLRNIGQRSPPATLEYGRKHARSLAGRRRHRRS